MMARSTPSTRQTCRVDRVVSSSLSAQVMAPAEIELQVAVASLDRAEEHLGISLDGVPVEAHEGIGELGGRTHAFVCGPGRLEVSYRARVTGRSEPARVRDGEVSVYRRPSRYAPSDHLVAMAAAEFGSLRDPAEIVTAVASWVNRRLSYVLGSSIGTDSAVETLLTGEGVCRDYAHLTTGLLRARDVPARLVAVYAPGLSPMDFHAVVEAAVDGSWYVVDSTGLAPRQSLVRIATGRDAADTAFMSNYGGAVRLDTMRVQATVDGELPVDDVGALVQLG